MCLICSVFNEASWINSHLVLSFNLVSSKINYFIIIIRLRFAYIHLDYCDVNKMMPISHSLPCVYLSTSRWWPRTPSAQRMVRSSLRRHATSSRTGCPWTGPSYSPLTGSSWPSWWQPLFSSVSSSSSLWWGMRVHLAPHTRTHTAHHNTHHTHTHTPHTLHHTHTMHARAHARAHICTHAHSAEFIE